MERENFCGIYFCDWSSGNVLRIFTFIFFLFIYVVFFCVLATNAQKLIKHQLILQKIIPLS